jgi:hypothetical protein
MHSTKREEGRGPTGSPSLHSMERSDTNLSQQGTVVEPQQPLAFFDAVEACRLCRKPFGVCQWAYVSCYGEHDLPRPSITDLSAEDGSECQGD